MRVISPPGWEANDDPQSTLKIIGLLLALRVHDGHVPGTKPKPRGTASSGRGAPRRSAADRQLVDEMAGPT
jgi:hypothetical protein